MLNKPKILAINTQFGNGPSKKKGLYGGVGYYRQRLPARHLTDFSFNHVGEKFLTISKEDFEDEILDLVEKHDLVFTKHLDNPEYIYRLLGACSHKNKPIIVDCDDRFFTTDGKSPPMYAYPDGSELRHYVETLFRESTALTASTDVLVDALKEYNEVHVLKNFCDKEDWKYKKVRHKRPVVGWAGMGAHAFDHPVLTGVYDSVIKKHPEVVFSFTGQTVPEHLKGVPRVNWEIMPPTIGWEGDGGPSYPKLLSNLGYDVGLAPIIESQFNEARSLVKWFEYTMAGIPMVASEWGPYKELVDGDEAYLVKTTGGWINAINYLLENPDDGKRLVENSRARIEREFSPSAVVPTWRDVFEKYLGNGFARTSIHTKTN